jgi:hypothetical protein
VSAAPFPRVNWPYIAFIVFVVTASLGFIAWAITSLAYSDWSQGLPIRGGWNWPAVIGLDVICAVLLVAFYWKVYCDVNTEIGDLGISRPSLRGVQSISWNQVTDIRVANGFGYQVWAGNQRKVTVTPYAYKDPKKIIQAILDRSRAVPQ